MLSLILATALSQSPDIADLEFVAAVEESIADVGAPPEPYKGLIAAMGGPSWKEREAAQKALQAASVADQRWLFRARKHRDPEIRVRITAIIRKLNPCASCKGSGKSPHYSDSPCWDCLGSGTIWLWSPWD